jgi:site-specific DNA recombinase
MEVGIYARRSRPEELEPDSVREFETSTERQLGACKQHADAKGWTVDERHIYREAGVSGYTGIRRDQFERLIGDLEAGAIKGVLVWKLDRLSRNRRDWNRLLTLAEERGTIVASVTEGLDTTSEMGGFVLELLGGIARMESKSNSLRTRIGKAALARMGEPSGGGPRRFGFEPDQVTIREDEAELLREAARRVLAGEGTTRIVKDWNRRGLTMPGGSPWQPTPLRRVLLAPRVAGLRQHQGEVLIDAQGQPVAAAWDAILDRATWERLRVVLLDPSRRKGGRPTSYLLSGFIFCHCGSRMNGQMKEGVFIYTCQQKGRGGCASRRRAAPIEDHVRNQVLDALSTPKLRAKIEALHAADLSAAQVAELTDSLDADAAKLAQLDALAADLDPDELMTARAKIGTRMDQTRRRLAEGTTTDALAEIPEIADLLTAAWDRWTLDKRRSVLKLVIRQVIAKPVAMGAHFQPEHVEIVWRV